MLVSRRQYAIAKVCACFFSISNKEVRCSHRKIPLRPEYEDWSDQLQAFKWQPQYLATTPLLFSIDQNLGKCHLGRWCQTHKHLLLLCVPENIQFPAFPPRVQAFICLICLAGDNVKLDGRGFREPKQMWRYHSNKTSGVRNGKKQHVRGCGNATANFPKLFSCTLTCQNLSEVYWANSATYGENSLSFQKKVIPSSFSLHEVLRIAVAKLEQSLVAEAFDSDFSHQSSPEAADPLCPTFPVLAARASLNTSWLHLLLLRPQLGFIADVECLVCPQVRPSSLSLRTIHNGSTSSVLPWWFFQPGSAEFSDIFRFKLRFLMCGICMFYLPGIPVTFQRHTLETKESGGWCDG